MKTKNVALVGLMVALICVVSPFTIPLPGLVPLSLSTFAVYLTAYLLGYKYGTLSVVIYIILGCIGLPVFSNFGSGFAKIAGPTGGYIVSYVLMAFILGIALKLFGEKRLVAVIAMLFGTLVNYAMGTAWFMHVTSMSLAKSLALCVYPFIIGDVLKMALVLIVAPVVKKRANLNY
ncbi:MAG TPA: biotin transporter BioY [Eubacterium sp.]|nr:biotin transporter BioY [Eubacterium sp.]